MVDTLGVMNERSRPRRQTNAHASGRPRPGLATIRDVSGTYLGNATLDGDIWVDRSTGEWYALFRPSVATLPTGNYIIEIVGWAPWFTRAGPLSFSSVRRHFKRPWFVACSYEVPRRLATAPEE
jgi:hypothetical protein